MSLKDRLTADFKEALKALEKQDGKALKLNEALAFASGIGFAGRMRIEEAAAGGWLRGLADSHIPSNKSVPSLMLPVNAFARLKPRL